MGRQIPGKRESRRFEGDYILRQQDVVEQRKHDDAVSFGGWSIDLHPADGVFSEKPGCNQWHAKGVYQIPYRSMYSRNIRNLFLAGRIISATHVAFGSSRVMATCAHNAQAVGIAAALCKDLSCRPRDLLEPTAIRRLQVELLRTGQHIPHVSPPDDRDLARDARVTASSSLKLLELPPTDGVVRLDVARAMLMPLRPGVVPEITFWAAADADVNLVVQLRTCSRDASFTPDEILDAQVVEVLAATVDQTARPAAAGAAAAVQSGERAAKGQATPTPGPELSVPTAAAGAAFREIRLRFDAAIESPRYAMVCFMPNPAVSLALSDVRVTGVLALVTHWTPR